MKAFHGYRSIKRVLILFIALGAAIQLAGVWLQLSMSNNAASLAAIDYQEELFQSRCNALTAYLDRKEKDAWELVFNEQIHSYAQADHLNRFQTCELVRAQMTNLLLDGSLITAQLTFTDSSSLRCGEGGFPLVPMARTPFFSSQYDQVQHNALIEKMLLCCRLPILGSVQRTDGAFMGELSLYYDVDSLLTDAFGSEPWAIADASGVLLCSADSEAIWEKAEEIGDRFIAVNGRKLHVQEAWSEKLGLRVISCYEDAVLYAGREGARNSAFQISLMVIACAVLNALLLYRSLLAPVEDIIRQIAKIRRNDAHRVVRNSECDEFRTLTREINSMLYRLRDHTQQEIKMQQEIYETGMRHAMEHTLLLQSQINPHFLYNNLECICGMVMSGNERAVRTMCTEMAFIYRYGTRTRSLLSTIEEEVQCAQRYERIVRLRFGEQFAFVFDIAPEVRRIQIPRMTLQPLLENAVLHGYANAEGMCLVQVRAWTAEERVFLTVEDAGCGMEEREMDRLNAELAACSKEQMLSMESDRIGVINICCRLQFMFGDDVDMRYEAVEARGTRVVIAYSGVPDMRLLQN